PFRYCQATSVPFWELAVPSDLHSFPTRRSSDLAIVIVPPGATAVGDAVTVGVGAASSFTIVPVPCAVPRPAFVGLLNVTTNVSTSADDASPLPTTATVCVAPPRANVSVPLAAT